ncbi:MAG: ACT domain-containing protein, partial [Kingella oralis]
RLLPLAPSVSIQPEEVPHRYTIQIIAANRPHLLADLTEVFAQHNIRLFYAKIATLADRAEDSFLVENNELANPSKEFALKRDLLAAMA